MVKLVPYTDEAGNVGHVDLDRYALAAHTHDGRRRLALLLCGVSGGTCALMMAAVLLAYGTPYAAKWWIVMAVILAAASTLPRLLVPAIEWVIDGYKTA
jgi:hypothetical protein